MKAYLYLLAGCIAIGCIFGSFSSTNNEILVFNTTMNIWTYRIILSIFSVILLFRFSKISKNKQ